MDANRPKTRTKEENQHKYKMLVARLQLYQAHPRFKAVHLIRGGKWVGSGTIVTNRRDIITCEHLFPPNEPSDYLSYEDFQPPSPELKTICRFTPDAALDIGLCTPGPPVIIPYRSKFDKEDWTAGKNTMGYILKEIEVSIYLATGESVRILGYMDQPEGKKWVLEYDACSGESGAGFARNDEQLFVLTDSLFVMEDQRKYFSIDNKFESVSLAVGINVH